MNTPQFDLGAMLSAPQTAIQQIPCDQLHPYHNHKFELYTGERLDDMIESIRENGVLSPIIVQVTLSLAFAILSEAALSFLGIGVEPDVPSWGMMLNYGKTWIELAWWVGVFPGAAIALSVLGFNVLGDGLRDILDPRLRNVES